MLDKNMNNSTSYCEVEIGVCALKHTCSWGGTGYGGRERGSGGEGQRRQWQRPTALHSSQWMS